MTTWTDLSAGAVGVGGIPSGSTVTALRDNPVAIAEGATGAPRVTAIARTCVKIFGAPGAGTDMVITGLAGYGGVTLDMQTRSGTTNSLMMNVSTDNGSTWSANYPVMSGNGDFVVIHAYYNFSDGVYENAYSGTSTTTESGAINALRFRRVSGGLSIPSTVCVTPDAGRVAL